MSVRMPGKHRVEVRHVAMKVCTESSEHRVAAEVDGEVAQLLHLHDHFDACIRPALPLTGFPARAPFPRVLALHATGSFKFSSQGPRVSGFCMEQSHACWEDVLCWGTLGTADLLRVVQGLTVALVIVHRRGAPREHLAGHRGGLHCDVKPRNVLLRVRTRPDPDRYMMAPQSCCTRRPRAAARR